MKLAHPTLAGLTLAAAMLAGHAHAAPKSDASNRGAAKANAAQVKRGQYLVSTSACIDCHTPLKMGANGPEPDMSRHLSGHPESAPVPPAPALPSPYMLTATETMTSWTGPWGTSFTANLTPDKETGLGNWTVEDFKATIRTGRHMGRGREILPPMPIPVYRNFTDQDLAAIFAYLQSLPAVKNRVPEPRPPVAAK